MTILQTNTVNIMYWCKIQQRKMCQFKLYESLNWEMPCVFIYYVILL